MYKNQTFLGIIPARGGSKRLPRKNCLSLAGKPLIAWTISAAAESKCLDDFIVSTDDREIASIARKYKARVPFERPAELASDAATSFGVVNHALHFLKETENKLFDFTVLLQPTSPLRTAGDIDAAIRLLDDKNADAVISVVETGHSPLWANILPPDRSLANFVKKDNANARSQDLPPFYRLNGALYICRTARLIREETFFFKDKIYAYIMPREHSVDIDSNYDLIIAEALARTADPIVYYEEPCKCLMKRFLFHRVQV